MRQVKKLFFYFAFGLFGLFASGFALDQTLKGQGGLDSISQALEAMKLKAKYPGMPGAEIQRLSQQAPKGATGLIESLRNSQALTDSRLKAIKSATENGTERAAGLAQTVYIDASENHNVLTERQLKDELVGAALPVGASETAPQGETVQLNPTADGREVIAVVKDSFNPEADIERINSLNVSDEIRQQILANYQQTGVLPKILVKETRAPASQPAGSDDPYNSKNW